MYEDPYCLQHFGVKGMKWGVRRSSGSGTATVSRRQNRKMNKTARKEYYQEKADHILKTALTDIKGGDTLIRVGSSVVTGQMFVHHVLRGNAINITATEIAGIRNPKTGYLEPYSGNYYGNYHKQNFRANPNAKYTGEDLSNKK